MNNLDRVINLVHSEAAGLKITGIVWHADVVIGQWRIR